MVHITQWQVIIYKHGSKKNQKGWVRVFLKQSQSAHSAILSKLLIERGNQINVSEINLCAISETKWWPSQFYSGTRCPHKTQIEDVLKKTSHCLGKCVIGCPGI